MSHILEFLDLVDVPNTYSGLPGRPVIVNATVDGVTFSDLAADYVSLNSLSFGGILNSGTQDVQTAMVTLDDHVHDYYLLRSEWNENGFVDKSDVAIAWNDGTRTLTISPAVDTFEYYYGGEKTTEDGSLYAIITDTEGLWVFYIAAKEAPDLAVVHNPSYAQVEDLILNHVIVAYVYWDATNNDGRLMDERHGSIMGRGTHHYLHEIFGSQYLSGMTLGDITTDQNGSLDAHAQFSITAGRFYDEDIEHETLAHASTDTWECYYVDGSGNVRWVNCAATFPVYAVGGVIAWNNAGTLTAADNNKYILYHVFSTNVKTDAGADSYPIVVPGIAQYGSKAAAQDAAVAEIRAIDFGDWPTEELIPIATVIYHHLSSMSNGVEAAIQSTEGGGDFVDWRFTTISGSSTSVNDHGGLSGLTDVADHPGYVTLDGLRPLTADWDAGSFEIRAESFQSDVATGTAPLTIASTTLVNNLNADLLDGNEASAFATSGHTHSYLPLAAGSGSPLTGDLYLTASGILLDNFEGIYMEDFGTTSRGVLYTNPDDELWVGNIVFDLQFAGSQTRPQYNGGDLALLSDVGTPSGVVLANGTVPLTADWDAGGYEIRARTLEADVATGTAPLTIASTTLVSNLNADLLDGNHASAFAAASHTHDSRYFTETESDARFVKRVVETWDDLGSGLPGTVNASGFFQTNTASLAEDWPLDTGNWMHLINCAHSSTGNYYHMQLAGDFFSQRLFFRETANSGSQAWKEVAFLDDLPSIAPQTLAAVNVYGTATSTSYTTCVDLSSGPYILHLVKNNDSTDDGYFQVTVDGTVVIADDYQTAGGVSVGAGSGMYALSISARTSLKVEAKIVGAGSMSWRVVYQQIGIT